MASKASHTNLGIPTLADATTLIGNVILEASQAPCTNFCIAHSAYPTLRIAGLETSEAPGTNFGIALLAYATPRKAGNMRAEATKAPTTNFGIAVLANAASRKVGDMQFEATETQCPHFCISLLAFTAPRKVGSMRLEATEAARADLGITLLADTTTVEEAIPIASEAECTDFLVASATDFALWWRPQSVDDMSREACKAAGAQLGRAPLTHTTSTDVGINQASQTKTTNFAISSFTCSAAFEQQIRSASEAICSNFLESAIALNTARTLKAVVYCAREAPRLNLAPPTSTIRASRHQMVSRTCEAQ